MTRAGIHLLDRTKSGNAVAALRLATGMSYVEPTPELIAPADPVELDVTGVSEMPVAGTATAASVGRPAPESIPVDLEPIAIDLADAEAALGRLDAGTYWTSEISGVELPDELLAASPATRRLPGE